MILKDKKIAIIGAGPVGLTLARLLQQKDIDVTVYERDKDPYARIWGGTLDLHKGTGQKAMQKAGLLDRYFALALPMGRTVTNAEAKVIFTREPDYEAPEINRNNLRMMLFESLKSDTVVWDCKVGNIEVVADVIIGADGGMSAMRKYVNDAEVEQTGTLIIQAEVFDPKVSCKEFYELCNGNILMTASNGTLLVANPDNNGSLTYAVMFKGDLNGEDANGLLSNRLSSWHECYKELFSATSHFVELPTRKISLDKPWKTDRPFPITLVGDAAHLMPPFAGQGVNIGLLDALILSENLTGDKFDSIEDAISDYEQQMFVYATAAQLESLTNEIEMHRPGFSFTKRFE